jgi:hormone-sensitive lipase
MLLSKYWHLNQHIPLKNQIKSILLSRDHVKIRILSPYSLSATGIHLIESFPFMNGYVPANKTGDSIIIHVHGGGFIAGSSRAQQSFTRRWANETGLTLFSIDYRLSPEYSYPSAIEDVWQGYYWIITYGPHLLGKEIKRIILIGDSAGGCLVTALTLKAVKSGIRKPDLLILGYPVLNLDPCHFYPSLLLGVDKVIIKWQYMSICNQFYVQDKDTSSDPYLSPMLAKNEDLAEFPEVVIMAAGKDSLRYHSYAFHNRLLYIYKLDN